MFETTNIRRIVIGTMAAINVEDIMVEEDTMAKVALAVKVDIKIIQDEEIDVGSDTKTII